MIVAGSTNPLLLASAAAGYNLTNSLRFRSSASAYLNRTPASAGNRQTWTYSTWLKRGDISGYGIVLDAGDGTSNNFTVLQFVGSGAGTGPYTLSIGNASGGAFNLLAYTSAVFRDPSAWYHIVLVFDTTNATSTNRVKLYVNNVLQTLSYTTGPFAQNTNSFVNNTNAHYIGKLDYGSTYFDGYLTETIMVDGQALTPSSFGETSATTGVWQPKRYTGTYGTNGFYLPFTDNSALTSGSNAGLGKDFSGNGNYWNTNNISITSGSTYDSMTDVPTLTSATASNFCTINPLDSNAPANAPSQTITNGNLKMANNTNAHSVTRATIAASSGKFYWEIKVDYITNFYSGICKTTADLTSFTTVGSDNTSWAYVGSNGDKRYNATTTAYGSALTAGDVLGCALDLDNGKVWWSKNGTWIASGDPATGANPAFTGISGDLTAAAGCYDSTINYNFGQQPFAYTPPTGYVALNTYNLPTPTIGATDSSQANEYFDATLWTGGGTSDVTVVNAAGFAPDLVWYKDRTTGSTWHQLVDRVCGNNLALATNNSDKQYTILNVGYTGRQFVLNSNGFTVNDGYHAPSGDAMVGWQWKANGSGSTNTAGSITSTVSANTTSGFSVVTYTGNGSSSTVGHGLGVQPSMIIAKNRTSNGTEWVVWNKNLPNSNYFLYLNLTNGQTFAPSVWGGTPTSTTFNVGTSGFTNTNGDNYVAYCFAAIKGFSAFGSYAGNGSTDGAFVYTGFRPKYVMLKSLSNLREWFIVDTSRSPYNVANLYLRANTFAAEGTDTVADILSNGFKLRNSDTAFNGSGETYIYMAFAESPFNYSLAR